jgi:Ca-activated chloride channel family protein
MKTIQSFLFVMMMAISATLFSQTTSFAVSGQVTDDQGNTFPGVSVVEKGTSNGVVTNVDGKYAIQLKSAKAILVFSFIGFETQEVTVANRTQINVAMVASTTSLEECVVVGYGTVKRSVITCASSSIAYDKTSRREKSKLYAPQACYDVEHNTESYAKVNENGFRDVTKEPLSTFSVDVDRASYANVRRYLNSGQLPPADAVRIEEMVNYFNYNYPQPKGNEPFSVNTEMAVCPWDPSHYILKVGLQGKQMDKSNLPPSNIVFLIDVSGSMNAPNKLPLLKSAYTLLVNELRPTDRVAIVVYAGAAGLVLPSTPGSEKGKILDAIERLSAGGSTAGGEGLRLAYAVAKQHYVAGGNNRIVLASDGDFNVGVSSNAEMERLVEAERNNGVFMTVLGFGMGNYKDDKMETIANKGNGNYAYIDNMQEAQKTLVAEFGGTMFTIAKDVKLQLEFNPANVAAYRLIGYENRLLNNEDFNDDKKDAGEIGAGHTVTALYELVPVDAPDVAQHTGRVDALKYQKKPAAAKVDYNNEFLTLKLRYKEPDGNQSKLLVTTVDGAVPQFEKASNNLRFAAGVAAFGMVLRGSEFKNDLTYFQAIEMLKSSKGSDEEGYRGEVVRLAKLAASLSGEKNGDREVVQLVE